MLSYVSIKFRGFNVVGLTYKIVFCLSVRLLVCYSCNLLFYLLSKSRSILNPKNNNNWKTIWKKKSNCNVSGKPFPINLSNLKNYCNLKLLYPQFFHKSENSLKIQESSSNPEKKFGESQKIVLALSVSQRQKFPLFAILKWRMNARKDVRKSILCRAAMQGKSGHVNH